jgi:hypothetical protein
MKDSERKFLELIVSLWEQETMFLSSPEHDHRYYRCIVAWGKTRPNDLIPWLLEVIQRNWHWCGALWEIVGQEKAPHIPEEHAGQGDYITQAWLAWGKSNGYS